MQKSYDIKGIMDDFASFITLQTPSETPFLTDLKTDSTPRPRYQWTIDNLSVDTFDGNGALEVGGAEGTSYPSVNPEAEDSKSDQVALMGYTQIFRKFLSISETANALSLAGRSNALAWELVKAAKNIKIRAEAAFLQNGQAVAENGQGTNASKTGGVKSQINTALIKTGVTLDNFTALFKSLEHMQSNADVVLVHPNTFPDVVKLFAPTTYDVPRLQWMGKDDEGNDKEYFTITSPFGRIFKVIPTRQMPDGDVFIYNSDYLSNVVFRSPKIVKLDPTGSTVKYLVEMECGVRVDEPSRCGYIAKT